MSDQEPATLAVVKKPELPEPVSRRGIAEAQWLTLCNNLFPGANPKSVLMVWDYCAARKLDPMKKPVHIVPMRVKNQATGQYEWRDVVMPGVYEHRITAQRTGEYLGHSKPEYGPEIEFGGVKAPEWCEMTMYRWNTLAKQKVEFPVRVYFREVVALKDGHANERWTRAPIQMLTKCTEAAGTREAFPEEIGGEPTAEEMDGQHAITEVVQGQRIPTTWDRISEGLRDNLERAFAILKLTEGQRLMKLNEYIPAEANADEGAEKLLAWCKAQLPSQKPKPDGNGKKVLTPSAPSVAASSPVDPKEGASDVRPAGAESPSGGSGHVAPPLHNDDIPWAKPVARPKAPEGELF